MTALCGDRSQQAVVQAEQAVAAAEQVEKEAAAAAQAAAAASFAAEAKAEELTGVVKQLQVQIPLLINLWYKQHVQDICVYRTCETIQHKGTAA